MSKNNRTIAEVVADIQPVVNETGLWGRRLIAVLTSQGIMNTEGTPIIGAGLCQYRSKHGLIRRGMVDVVPVPEVEPEHIPPSDDDQAPPMAEEGPPISNLRYVEEDPVSLLPGDMGGLVADEPEPEPTRAHVTRAVINNTPTPSLALEPEMVDTLREMAGWWQEKGKDLQNVTFQEREPVKLSTRPVFPGGADAKTSTGIRVNSALLNAAMAKAKGTPEEMYRSGGTLSSLIETLLWGYLGEDPKFLAGGDN